MKVKISYTIDIEDVPARVKEILSKMETGSITFDGIFEKLEGGNIPAAVEEIDKVRQQMGNLDVALVDCTGILEGYQAAQIELRKRSNEPSPHQQHQQG
tara:strand:+ start:9709 stop:10005 length:297 start_codon:yes stop_codon:yes gene_type:complete